MLQNEMHTSARDRYAFSPIPVSYTQLDVYKRQISNSARERTVEAARVLDVYLVRNAMKPFARGYVRACAALGVPCDRAVMIGDQSYTDVLGAHRIGMDAVLVAPQPGSDPLHTHILRVLDRRAVRGMRAIGSMS